MKTKPRKTKPKKEKPKKPGRKELGERIVSLRKAQKMSQDQLGFEAGLTRQYVSELESGHKSATLDTMIKLAGVFHIHVKELLDFKY